MKKTSLAMLLGLFAAGCGSETAKPAPPPVNPNSAEMMMKMHNSAPGVPKKEGDAATDDKKPDATAPAGDEKKEGGEDKKE